MLSPSHSQGRGKRSPKRVHGETPLRPAGPLLRGSIYLVYTLYIQRMIRDMCNMRFCFVLPPSLKSQPCLGSYEDSREIKTQIAGGCPDLHVCLCPFLAFVSLTSKTNSSRKVALCSSRLLSITQLAVH